MQYGELPKQLGQYIIDCQEMMSYQYLPIKMIGEHQPVFEQRLNCFKSIVGAICCDFIGEFGLDRYVHSYVYLTAKYAYQTSGCSYNRMGYHSDGFMTEDINYVWCDINPTVFNTSKFELTQCDTRSLGEMAEQAKKENEFTFSENSLLRLNQFNVHKVGEQKTGMRAFLKISFSTDKYDLKGNAHNYLFDYNWEMKERKIERNMPQTVLA